MKTRRHRRGIFLRLLFLLLLPVVFPQLLSAGSDTIRVASYNILNYGGSGLAADAALRNPYFRRVVHTMAPDILVSQEVISQAGVDSFRNGVLNYYQSGLYSSVPFHDGEDTDNALFYKSSKVTFISASYIGTALRDIAEYIVRINGTQDTLRMYSVHLKASSGGANEDLREAEATILRNYLNALPSGSQFIIVGDYNIYRSSEAAFQKLIGSEADNDGRVRDPLNAVGTWNGNSAFESIHTQSPRTRSFGGGSTGGLDDRFDMILPSYALDDNIITSSYTAYGNDGNHLNDSINKMPNTAVPDSVAHGLHYASDHIPVYCNFTFGTTLGSFTLVAPSSGSANQAITGTLRWNVSAGATSYSVKLDTVNPPVSIVNASQTDTVYSYSGLTKGKTYYWSVTSTDGSGTVTATGAPWNFATVAPVFPGAFSLTAPADLATDQGVSGTLTWAVSTNATGYDVYLQSANPPATLVSSNQAGTQYSYSGLSRSTTYYWKVVARTSDGTTTATGAPRRFTTVPPDPGAFTLLSPSHGTTSAPLSGTLRWARSSSAASYDVYLDTLPVPAQVVSASQPDTSYSYGGLSYGTTYYWKVVAKNAAANVTAGNAPISFTTLIAPPAAFALLLPGNNTTGQAASDTLVWERSTGATGYDLYLDTQSSPATLLAANLTDTFYLYGSLVRGEQYYWSVRAKNSTGTTEASAAPFTFTILPPDPEAFVQLSPANGVSNVSLSGTLRWGQSQYASSYDVYFDTISPPAQVVSASQSETTYAFSGLSYGREYYWRIVAKNSVGTVAASNGPLSFTTVVAPPAAFTLLAPANNAVNRPLTDTLVWSRSAGATAYDLYLETQNPPVTLAAANLTDTSYIADGLTQGQQYYWKVTAKNTIGSISAANSPLRFTTMALEVPGTVTLLLPEDGAAGQSLSPTLRWAAATAATSYMLEVGTDSTFASGVVLQDTALIDTFTTLAGLEYSTRYYWHVKAKNSNGTSAYSAARSFTTHPQYPAPPVLLSPTNSAADQPVTLAVSWNASDGANSYRLQVARDEAFTDLFVNDTALAATSAQIGGLANATTYYWRVAGASAGGVGEWSAPWHFTTIMAAPAVPLLLVPAQNAIVVATDVTLEWNVSATASFYHVQVAYDSTFVSLALDNDNVSASTLPLGDLAIGTAFYWRVNARNTGGTSAWSEQRKFTTLYSFDYSLLSGWNLVSLPLDAANSAARELFPGAISRAYSFSCGEGYVGEDTLRPGVGYWLKFNGAQERTIFGTPISADTVDVCEGWNLIGAVAASINSDDIDAIDTEVISKYFEYTGTYSPVTVLEPGKGYWVKVNAPGRLVLRTALAAAQK